MLDRVISLVPGAHAVGIKNVTGNEYGLSTRDHGFIFPAPLALEALVQLATVVVTYGNPIHTSEGETSSPLVLTEVQRLEIHRELLWGDRLYLSVTILSHRPLQVEGQVSVAGEAFVDAVFQMGPADEGTETP